MIKLARIGAEGQEQACVVLEDGRIFDVSALTGDFDGEFFANNGWERIAQLAKQGFSGCTELKQASRFGPCIKNPSKIIGVGKNYLEHAIEFGEGVPENPVLFLKAPSALCGCSDALVCPPQANRLDYEVELAVIIGKRGLHIDEADAADYIAGYCLINDYSERHYQKDLGGQWIMGKSYPSFAPLGPWLLAPGDIDADNIQLELSVNGEMRQKDSTASMRFKVPALISYISRFMRLEPGDVIATGTPSGVAMGRKDAAAYLRPGDVIRYSGEALGAVEQVCTAQTL